MEERSAEEARKDRALVDKDIEIGNLKTEVKKLEAEIVRDLNLAVAGLLSDKVGGPSVFPPLPAGITNLSYANSFKWNLSKGEDRYRRGLYTFFKRTSPHPNLLTFDCPDSNVACVKRSRSNTPLAALVTLNNATFTEAAKAFAQRIMKEASAQILSCRTTQAVSCATGHPSAFESEAICSGVLSGTFKTKPTESL